MNFDHDVAAVTDAVMLGLVQQLHEAARAIDRASELFAAGGLGDAMNSFDSILLSARAIAGLVDGIAGAVALEPES